MATPTTSLESLTRKAERPERWADPLDPEMSEELLDMLMAEEPFASMDLTAFPKNLQLRDILKGDSAVRDYDAGEIVLRKDDYGTSAFIVLGGEVEVLLRPEIAPELLGRAPRVKKGLFSRFAQLWNNSPEPEGWSDKSPRAGDQLSASGSSKQPAVYLQDYPKTVIGVDTVALGKGSLFGEISALSRMPRTATIIASAKKAKLVELTWEGLRDIMRYDAALKNNIDKIYRENSLKNFLMNHEIFAHLDESEFSNLCDEAQLQTYGDYNWSSSYKKLAKSGDSSNYSNEPLIAKEGEYSNGIYMIRGGFCRVSQKHGSGERTLNYIGAGGMFGYGEIASQMKGLNEDPVSRYTLRSLGYAHLIFIPTATVQKYANRFLEDVKFPSGSSWEDDAKASVKDETAVPPPNLMEFMGENRFFNGTKSMVIDMDLCTRCDDCVRACSSTHDGNPRFLRHGPIIENMMVANACMHCVDPVCMIGCPTGAIHRTSFGGEVVINPSTCIGCSTCANNCPYEAIRMVDVRSSKGQFLVDDENQPIMKATKCDLCVEQKGGPACQNACPHGALSRTDLTDASTLTNWPSRR